MAKDIVRKLNPISSFLVEAIDFSNIPEMKESVDKNKQTIRIGGIYSLKGKDCDGFKGNEKRYIIVAAIYEYEGTPINSFVVKQISGPKGPIFTLSKNDCKIFGFEYEPGLQLFPMNMDWIPCIDKVEFNPNDMSTFPKSEIDGSIRHALIKVGGFADYRDGYVVTPGGKLIHENELNQRIVVTNKMGLVFGDGKLHINEGEVLCTNVFRPNIDGVKFKYGNDIDDNGFIYVGISFSIHHYFGTRSNYKFLGLKPDILSGVNINDAIEVSVDETNALTPSEYETLKKKRIEEKENAMNESDGMDNQFLELFGEPFQEIHQSFIDIFDSLASNVIK